MGAAYLQAALNRRGSPLQVESAGLHAVAGAPAAMEARRVVAEDGLSLERHRSRPVEEDLVRSADLVLAMTRSQLAELQRRFPEIRGRVGLWRQWAAGRTLEDPDVPDPFGGTLEEYRTIARQLREEADAIARRLAAGRPGGQDHALSQDDASSRTSPGEAEPLAGDVGPRLRVAIGSDHAGFDLKQALVQFLMERGEQVIDVGTDSRESCDYPDFARMVCEKVSAGEADRGVLICGTGIGMAIAANKWPGIRAACCAEPYSARLTRQDNDSNVLTMGARVVGPGLAREILAVWLDTAFAGGRHQRRLDKIAALEAQWLKHPAGHGGPGAGRS